MLAPMPIDFGVNCHVELLKANPIVIMVSIVITLVDPLKVFFG
jgi:hypothetical protein